MTEKLHTLIDSGASQSVINERIAGLMESTKRDLDRVGTDHEKRIRFLEKSISYTLGAIGAISALLYLISILISVFKK